MLFTHNPTVAHVSVSPLLVDKASFHKFVKAQETAVTDNQNLFNGLALPEREVLALYYGCQLSVGEMATILNCSIGTV